MSLQGLDCSLLFKGRFYPNVWSRRRGRTSMSWAKPKLKFDFPSFVSHSVFPFKALYHSAM